MRTIVLGLCFFLTVSAFGQDEKKREEIQNSIEEELHAAAKASYLAHMKLRLDALADHFDLSETEMKKARLFAKKVAADQAKACKTHIERFLADAWRDPTRLDLLNSTVSVNGIQLDGEVGAGEIKFVVDVPKRWICWNANSGGSGSWMNTHEPADFSQDQWVKPFAKVLDADQLANYQDKFKTWEGRNIALGGLRLSSGLSFTADQDERVIADLVDASELGNQSTFGELRGLFTETRCLARLQGDYLTEEQAVLIQYLGRRYGRGPSSEGRPKTVDGSISVAAADKVREAIERIVAAEIRIEYQEWLREIEFTEAKKKRLGVVVNGIIAKTIAGIMKDNEQVFKNFKSDWSDENRAFTFDEKMYKSAEADVDKPDSQVVGLQLVRASNQCRLICRTKNGRSQNNANFSMSRMDQAKLIDNELWKRELDSAKLARWESRQIAKLKSSVVDATIATVTLDLVLSEKQESDLRDRLTEEVVITAEDVGGSVYAKTVGALKSLEPADFTEAQSTYLRIVQGRLN